MFLHYNNCCVNHNMTIKAEKFIIKFVKLTKQSMQKQREKHGEKKNQK